MEQGQTVINSQLYLIQAIKNTANVKTMLSSCISTRQVIFICK